MKLTEKHCVPCEGGTQPLTRGREEELLELLDAWQPDRSGGPHKLRKEFKFKNFRQAMIFVNAVADIAEAEQHHPDIQIVYNRVSITLFTHAIKGLSENDFIVAAKIDALQKQDS